MLEQLLIFTRGGLILWTCKEIGNALKGSPIDTLIRSCLLEERSGDVSFNYDAPGAAAYTLKWTFHNDLGLVFVAVYQRILHLLYVDDLLSMVKQSFSEIYDPKRVVYDDFDETFRQLREEAEARAEELRKTKQVGKPVSNVKKQGHVSKGGSEGGNKKMSEGGSKKDDGDGDKAKASNLTNGHHSSENHNRIEDDSRKSDFADGKENTSSNVAVGLSKLQKLRSKGVRGRGGLRKTDSLVSKGSKVAALEPAKEATKKNRVWDDAAPKHGKLDFTDSVGENGNNNDHVDIVAVDQGESMMDKDEVFSSDGESENNDEHGRDEKPEAKKKGWFSSVFQR